MPSDHYFVMRKANPCAPLPFSFSCAMLQSADCPESPIHERTACNVSMQTAAFALMHRFSGWCLMAVPALLDITIDVIVSGNSVVKVNISYLKIL